MSFRRAEVVSLGLACMLNSSFHWKDPECRGHIINLIYMIDVYSREGAEAGSGPENQPRMHGQLALMPERVESLKGLLN